jgi:hypothetical protein
LHRRNGNGETPASQSNQNSICKAYLCEDHNSGEIRIIFSRPHAYRKESNRGWTAGASIRLKHNVPRPYHDPGKISSMASYKRQGIARIRGEQRGKTKNREEPINKTNTSRERGDRTEKKEEKSKEGGRRENSPGVLDYYCHLRLRHRQVRSSLSLCFCLFHYKKKKNRAKVI